MAYANANEIKMLLITHQHAIVEQFNTEDIDVYVHLHHEMYNNPNNPLFQFVYKAFYRLDNLSITTEFENKYFELLSKLTTKNLNLTNVTCELYRIENQNGNPSMHFPLVTSMYNTLNPYFPTYNREIATAFRFTTSKHLSGFYKKMKRYIEQYRHLHQTYQQLLKDNELLSLLQKIDHPLPNVKKLEILIIQLSRLS